MKEPNPMKTEGDRIRFLRQECRLSRREMAERHQLKEPTLRSWELDVSSITNGSMKKLLKGLAAEGIACRPDWIRRGIGQPPFMQGKPMLPLAALSAGSHHSETIALEVDTFLKQNPNRLVHVVKDTCNEPYYLIGDTLGAIRMDTPPTEKDEGTLCVIAAPDAFDGYALRKIYMEGDGLFTLTSFRCEDQAVFCPIYYGVQILEWAPVIWHRRLNP